MVLDVREVLSLLVEETRRRGLPVPVRDPEGVVYGWSRGLGLPREGRVLLFTGALYQLMPYINALVRGLEALEGRRASGIAMRLARRLRLADLASLVARPDKRELEYSRRILSSIAGALRRAGVEPAYPERVDWYSGVLLYDMGLDEAFAEHAAGVAEAIRRFDPDLIVTVDPHTTMALREAYPRYVDGFDYEVKPYLQVLAEAGYEPPTRSLGDWVYHDPCLYARGAGVIEEPRRLLEAAGARVLEPRRSRRMTYCCGGPLESISPRLSRRIAEARLRELSRVSSNIVVACPICLANLSRAARSLGARVRVEDASILLGGGD